MSCRPFHEPHFGLFRAIHPILEPTVAFARHSDALCTKSVAHNEPSSAGNSGSSGLPSGRGAQGRPFRPAGLAPKTYSPVGLQKGGGETESSNIKKKAMVYGLAEGAQKKTSASRTKDIRVREEDPHLHSCSTDECK